MVSITLLAVFLVVAGEARSQDSINLLQTAQFLNSVHAQHLKAKREGRTFDPPSGPEVALQFKLTKMVASETEESREINPQVVIESYKQIFNKTHENVDAQEVKDYVDATQKEAKRLRGYHDNF